MNQEAYRWNVYSKNLDAVAFSFGEKIGLLRFHFHLFLPDLINWLQNSPETEKSIIMITTANISASVNKPKIKLSHLDYKSLFLSFQSNHKIFSSFHSEFL